MQHPQDWGTSFVFVICVFFLQITFFKNEFYLLVCLQFLVVPCGMWDLSFWARVLTLGPPSESSLSYILKGKLTRMTESEKH